MLVMLLVKNILQSQSEKVGNGEVINIGNGDNRSINDIKDMIGGDRINVEPVIEPNNTNTQNNSLQKNYWVGNQHRILRIGSKI